MWRDLHGELADATAMLARLKADGDDTATRIEAAVRLDFRLLQIRSDLTHIEAQLNRAEVEWLRSRLAALAGVVGPDAAAPRPTWWRARLARLFASDARVIANSRLFDADYYRRHHLTATTTARQALRDFVQTGWRKAQDPHRLFSVRYYLETNPDVAQAAINPLVHFIRRGADERRDPSPHFSTRYYVEQNPDAGAPGVNPLVHYLEVGEASGRPCRPLVAGAAPMPRGEAGGSTADDRRSEMALARVRRAAAQRAEDRAQVAIAPAPSRRSSNDRSPVSFPGVVAPAVSVVIRATGSVDDALHCLRSLKENSGAVAYEVIVITAAVSLQGSVDPAIFVDVANDRTSGEALALAADRARGEVLVFVEAAVEFSPDWIGPLLRTLSADEVGVAAPRVLTSSGRLRSAGALVGSDGRLSPIGVGASPDDPRYGYSRQVEAIDGICLAVRASWYRELAMRGPVDLRQQFFTRLCLGSSECGRHAVFVPAATLTLPHDVPDTAEPGHDASGAALPGSHTVIERFTEARVLAFYLPQFHPVVENDQWWGRGFSEWRNTAKARPNFIGHDQPRLPADLGFYDLRIDDVYRDQVDLARTHGISGFCFYYYWFAGRRILETPLERLLAPGAERFPFCLAWANENWTRRWDGRDDEVLLRQDHGDDDDRRVIADLRRYLSHPNYIRINGRPLLLVYRARLFPDIRRTTDTWRDECRRAGLGDIYLAAVASFELTITTDVEALGFDAVVEFPPHNRPVDPIRADDVVNPDYSGFTFDYEAAVVGYMQQAPGRQRCFRGVMPAWDNTARKPDHGGGAFVGSTPGAYQAWLEWALDETRRQNFGDERIVFVNAWNEWAEGAYLEPDLRWGRSYLRATHAAVQRHRANLGKTRSESRNAR